MDAFQITMTKNIELSQLHGFRKFAFVMEIIFLIMGLIGAIGILLQWLF